MTRSRIAEPFAGSQTYLAEAPEGVFSRTATTSDKVH